MIRYVTEVQGRILQDIADERRRQDTLKAQGRFPHTCADSMPAGDLKRFAVLAEELGEVARVVNDASDGNVDVPHLREELIQVAAVVLAWCEWIDAPPEHCPRCGFTRGAPAIQFGSACCHPFHTATAP